MAWLLVGAFVLIICFSFVIIYGAPYLPTRKKQIDQALELLDLKPSELLLELGAGSGGLTIAAAKKGIHVRAYELNPVLVFVLKLRTRKFAELVDVRMANFWNADFSDANGIYVFLLDRYMGRLDKKVSESVATGTKLVSYTFEIKSKRPNKRLGPMYLYKY